MITLDSLLFGFFAATVAACPGPPLLHQPQSCLGPPQVWDARPSPGKGMGVYAMRTLVAGDVILSEPPIIRLTPPEFRDGVAYPLADIRTILQTSFDELTNQDKAEVMSLHAHMTTSDKPDDRLMSILRSNAYTTGNSLGLFPKGARINHSCRPNSSQYWSEQLGRRIVVANRRIEEGEEIFATYIPLLYAREDRQSRLDQYGFKCTCEACALDEDAQKSSDRRRLDLQNAFTTLESQLSLTVPQSKAGKKKAKINAEASNQLIELVEEEGLADYYAKAYQFAGIGHARIEDWKAATLWANKGYELSLLIDPHSAITKELQVLTSRFITSWNEELRSAAML